MVEREARHADELSFERIIESVAGQYFYPILRGDLIVEVIDGAREQRITAETIDGLAPAESSVARVCELTRWSLSQTDETKNVLAERGAAAPRWDENDIAASTLTELRDRFASGERLAFRVPILVKRNRSKAASSWFDVYLEHDDQLRRGEHHFIRRGITIPDIRTGGDKAARALIVIDDQPLSTFTMHRQNARLLLHPPVHQHGAFIYNLGFRRDLITNRGLIEAIDLLYWDPKRKAPKRGATTETRPGNLRRLITVVQQLDFNYDLYGMRAEEILQLLPAEFDAWRPAPLLVRAGREVVVEPRRTV